MKWHKTFVLTYEWNANGSQETNNIVILKYNNSYVNDFLPSTYALIFILVKLILHKTNMQRVEKCVYLHLLAKCPLFQSQRMPGKAVHKCIRVGQKAFGHTLP